jgi:hypothetical protein
MWFWPQLAQGKRLEPLRGAEIRVSTGESTSNYPSLIPLGRSREASRMVKHYSRPAEWSNTTPGQPNGQIHYASCSIVPRQASAWLKACLLPPLLKVCHLPPMPGASFRVSLVHVRDRVESTRTQREKEKERERHIDGSEPMQNDQAYFSVISF